MVEVQILGKSYPLCLTVAALDDINAKCGGLNQIGTFLGGKVPQRMIITDGEDSAPAAGTMEAMVINTTWLLGVLLREGENSRLQAARLSGEAAQRRAVPDSQELAQLLTVASAMKYRAAVFDAVAESMNREIEALYPKNKDAEQE